MTYTMKHARSGLTAIAAVLALSSTPILAQETSTPPDPVADTLASESPPEATSPEPESSETTAKAAPAEVAPTPTVSRRAPPRERATSPTADRASTERAPAAASAVATPTMERAQPTPASTATPTGEMVEPGPMPVGDTAMETTAAPPDDALPIAGAAGLALLALGGIGMAVGRRRQRRQELAHQQANREYLASHPDTPAPAPAAFVGANNPAFATPALAGSGVGQPLKGAPRTKLPPNFDLSRFGPHTRAAYLGPTEDNPSLSLKHRLRRAAALDQQARQHGEAPREAAHVAPRRDDDEVNTRPDQPRKPLWNSDNDGFMLRRASDRPRSKPAYQH